MTVITALIFKLVTIIVGIIKKAQITDIYQK